VMMTAKMISTTDRSFTPKNLISQPVCNCYRTEIVSISNKDKGWHFAGPAQHVKDYCW
jgi:hypothetical protein